MARKVVGLVSKGSDISAEDKELYEYGFHMLFANVFFFLLCVLFGCLHQIVVESIVFFILFNMIRSCAGGVHAKKEISCTILTSCALFLAIKTIKWSVVKDAWPALLLVFLLSLISILACSPLDSPEKPLTHEERKQYRRKTYFLLLLICIIAAFSFVIQRREFFYACIASLGLEGILILIGYLRKIIAK